MNVRSGLHILVARSEFEDAKVVLEAAPTVFEIKCIVTVPEIAVVLIGTLQVGALFGLVIRSNVLYFNDVEAVSEVAEYDANLIVLAERFGLRAVDDVHEAVPELFAVAFAKENVRFVHHDPKGNETVASILHAAA